MPEILPFRNFHYRIGKNNSDELRKLVAPPYDVISEEEKIKLKKNPDNICHVILPDKYEAAGLKLDELISNNILVSEKNRCICIYGIDYKRPDTGEKISRYGFVGLLKLVEIFPANDGVIPHESTFRKFTEDRLRIIQETDGNFSPIFTIYNGKNGTAEKLFKKFKEKKPFLKTIDRDGFTHKIWEVFEKEDIEKFQEIVKKHTIIIADGHHRYVTSLRHSRRGGCKYIMALFIDFNDPGLIIYTSHRQIDKMPVNDINEFIEAVKGYFKVKTCQNFSELQSLMGINTGKHVFGCYFKKTFFFLQLFENICPEDNLPGKFSDEWKCLNIPILHQILFRNILKLEDENITFIKDVNKGLKNVDDGKNEALFMLNPTTLEEVHTITKLGEIMPQKSTYFYPKPLSGLIIHKHVNDIE